MSILPNETYSDLINDLHSKFPELQNGKGLEVRFKDEDGDILNMEDEGDFEAAIDVARWVFLPSSCSSTFMDSTSWS
jgi:neutrophil factor 2